MLNSEQARGLPDRVRIGQCPPGVESSNLRSVRCLRARPDL